MSSEQVALIGIFEDTIGDQIFVEELFIDNFLNINLWQYDNILQSNSINKNK